MNFAAVGRGIPRRTGAIQAAGRAQYGVDFTLPRMLWGAIVRSEQSHARIVKVDVSRALAHPGVKAVVTGQEAPDGLYGARLRDEPIFAKDRVRYVGEPVAAVAAVDADTAAEAARLVKVEYEPLPHLFTTEEALREGAVLIHPDLGTYFHRRYDCHPVAGTNIASHIKIRKGDVNEGFARADVVYADAYHTQAVHCAYIEPHAAVADWDATGKLTVWSSTQCPFLVRSQLAIAMRMPVSRIRVLATAVGGGFGGKALMKIEGVCALLAQAAGRPVKMVLTRAEEFTATSVRHPFTIDIKTGARRDGTLVACEARLVIDNGAYSQAGDGVCWEATIGASGPYVVPHQKVDGLLVYTNRLPSGPFRGFGWPQATWAFEQNMDGIAHQLGMDPLEIRLQNAVEEGSISSTGEALHSVGLKACLQAAADSIGWDKRVKTPYRGYGLAAITKLSVPFTASSSFLKINEDGRVHLLTGAVDIGQGSDMALIQIAAEELGFSPDAIDVMQADTDSTPFDDGARSSRLTFHMGNAVRKAAADARQELLRRAADIMEVAAEDLVVQDGRVSVVGSPGRSMGIGELVVQSHWLCGGPILGRGSIADDDVVPMDPETGQSPHVAPYFEYGAQAVEVAIDPESGRVRVVRVVSAHDCGRAINPLAVEGQIEGGLAMGLGYALMEEVHFEEGRVTNPSFMDYLLPTSLDMPPVTSIIVEGFPHKDGPFGAKGVGEASTIGIAAAIGNAIFDATGRRIKDLPITWERMLEALEGDG